MKILSFIVKIVIAAAILNVVAFGQNTASQPRQEKLLNGLKVLLWPDASARNVEVRIRLHSGAAFDPQGKEGVMKLLAENIFPTEVTREYFKDDLGGGLEVLTTYDYIQITATGKTDSFFQILETISTAVANPTIDKETTARLKAALLATVAQLELDPAYVADRAAAKQLFGKFPYGRAPFGTADSIQKIDFADLIDAKQRFLTADNATLSVSGNLDRTTGMRAIRRYFGAWLKADKRVPTTFRQPDPPVIALQTVASPRSDTSTIRFAARGTARKDKDFAASRVFANVVEARLRSRIPATNAAGLFVRSEEHVLPGTFIIGISAPNKNGNAGMEEIVAKSLLENVSDSEFAAARSRFEADWSKNDLITAWLDADTFGLQNPAQEMRLADSVTLDDVNSYGASLRKMPMVAVQAAPQPPVS